MQGTNDPLRAGVHISECIPDRNHAFTSHQVATGSRGMVGKDDRS